VAEDDDVSKVQLRRVILGGAIDEAADDEAEHVDLTLEADELDIYQATELVGGEEAGVEAVL
jgi:hypothetical protein